ncbi:MAG: hypothetical protein GXO86_01895 [Chlorobi bacterium]|nr:hypothetical protein [Chlorobiota bacterium]
MSKTRLTILFFLFVFPFIVFGQKLKPVRLEVPAGVDVESFHVEKLKDKKLLIFYESNEVNNDGLRKWYFGLFNASLKQKWLKFIPLTDKLMFLESKMSGDRLYLFFRNSSRSKTDLSFYDIVSYNMVTEEFSKVSGTFPQKSEIGGFEVIDNTGCLALNLKGLATDLVFIDLLTGDVNPLHVEEGNDNFIMKLYADKKWKRFYIALKTSKDNRYINDEIISFTKAGQVDKVLQVEMNENLKVLSDFVFVPEDNRHLKVFGIYDIYTGNTMSMKYITDNENEEAHSVGMFYLEFENGQQKTLKFYDFMQMNNIPGSLGSGKMEYRKNVRRADDMKKISGYFHFIDPEIIKVNDQYVFSVEAYRPYYQTETRMDYDFYGRPVPYSYRLFVGYEFYDVVVLGLSENGELIWNNDFTIRDLISYSLARNSVVFNDDNFVNIAYVNNGKIFLKTIEGPVDIGNAETSIVTKIPNDRVTADNYNRLIKWYDNYYLVYGYQKLKNRSLDEQNIRTVFYLNKVAYN